MGKVLREGYTTGATATVAMKAAVLAIKGEFPKQVTVLSPQRTEITLPVQSASAENNIGTATVLKDAGDDLDCTNGTPIVVTVELTDKLRNGTASRQRCRHSYSSGAASAGWSPCY